MFRIKVSPVKPHTTSYGYHSPRCRNCQAL